MDIKKAIWSSFKMFVLGYVMYLFFIWLGYFAIGEEYIKDSYLVLASIPFLGAGVTFLIEVRKKDD